MKSNMMRYLINKKAGIFIVFLAAAAVTFTGCGPKVAFRPDYNFNKIERVGVLRFDSSQIQIINTYNDPGNAVADEFVFQLLSRGTRVVERSRIESILREQHLWKSGNIDPATIREMGKILGVDALIMGTVTRYIPDRKERVYIKDDKGELQEEIFLIEAEIGISARMVDVVTGEVIWASSYFYDSFYVDSAIRQAVSAILDSLKKVWFING
ncbi:MAG: CsgG/HfaB family protein [Elusimicrobiota bacterium]